MKSIRSVASSHLPWVRRVFAAGVVFAFASAAVVSAYDSALSPAVPQTQKSDQKASNEIGIDNFSFKPDKLIVPAGTKVTWTNHDDVPHIVVSADKHFTSSPALDTGDKYSYVFDKPGSYEYFCSLHPKMVGRVIVN